LTLFVDGFSRVVPGWALSIQPSSASILAAFGAGISVSPACSWGGVPVRGRVDRGADFLGAALGEACGRLGVMLTPVAADSPFLKGKVEAGGKGLDRGLLPPLPGYRGAGPEVRAARSSLLSFDDLVELLRVGINEWNRTHRHPVLGCPLAEAWQRDATPIRTIEPARLRWMMLAVDHRIVQTEGVRFRGRYYTAPELTGQRGREVRVLYWPHDARRIEVTTGEEWLCTAWPQGALSPGQREAVLTERRRQQREVDRLRRRAARRIRRRFSPATITEEAQDTTVVTAEEAEATPAEGTRVVSLLRLETDG
jgi:putative transposase